MAYIKVNTSWKGGIHFFQYQNYLAWPVSSDVIRDYFSQTVLCLGIIISQNVLWLRIVILVYHN